MRLFLAVFFLASIFISGKLFAESTVIFDNQIDLGNIENKGIIEKEIPIKNQSGKALIVKAVNSSCSCIKIISPKRTTKIFPDEDFHLKISINPRGYIGEVHKSLYLITDSLENSIIRLTVKFNVTVEKEEILSHFSEFNMPVVLSAGLIDSFNPCAFSVMVFFISFLLFKGFKKKYILVAGLAFLLGVFIAYFLIGLGIVKLIQEMAYFDIAAKIFNFAVSGLAFTLGFISIGDYLRFKKDKDYSSMRLKLPEVIRNTIHKVIRDDFSNLNNSVGSITLFFLGLCCGLAVSILESVCTGQIYLPTLTYILNITHLKSEAFFLLLLYNVCFIMPLIAIFGCMYIGLTSDNFNKFMLRHLAAVKIATALIFLILGFSLLIINLL